MTYYGVGIDTAWLYSIIGTPKEKEFGERVQKFSGLVGTADKVFGRYTVLLFNRRIEAECARIRLYHEGIDVYGLIVKAEGGVLKNDG